MSDRYWSIKRDGHNRQYRNPGALPFAPESPADADEGRTYFAGQFAGGRDCGARCGRYIAVTSRIVAAEGRWMHERCANPRRSVAFTEDDPQPARRLAHVSDERFGEIELKVPFDRDVIDAIKACKRGRVWASWVSDRRDWQVPALLWPCVERALVEHGYEIRTDLARRAGGR